MQQRNGGIYIALGANLPSRFGAPRETLEAVLGLFASRDMAILRRSSWWRSAAQPAGDQPDFINAVVEVETGLQPQALLMRLHELEAGFGRVRRDRWEARVLDLDLVDYQGQRSASDRESPILPHPRMRERLFVLLPLQEVAPGWRHPADGAAIADLIAEVNPMEINKLS